MSFMPYPLAPATLPEQSYQQCYSPTISSPAGLHTQSMTPCSDRLEFLQPASPMSDLKDHSPTFSSGSSAQNSSNVTDEDIEEREHESPFPISFSYNSEVIEYRSLLDAPPIYSLDSVLGYGAERVVFIEKLLWNCVGKVYGIYGEPIIRTGSPAITMPLQQLVHEGIVHGLCNEIVIMPIMAATQKLQGTQSHHTADVIPFPLFMAEMLRRMRSSYFLLQTAMRYILDVEPQIRAARERAACGWCRSGIYGCEHSTPPETGGTSRFAKGRSAILRKPATSPPLKSADFTNRDALYPLADARKAFLGALILANKFHRDRSIGNKAWAAMIGLQLEEVHSAERAVGQALGWTLSRPWVRDARDDSGVWMPGSTHPSFAEPLFASTETEVIKYGVKALRTARAVPVALGSHQLAAEFPRGDIHVDSIYSTPPLYTQAFPSLDATPRRSRSQTLSVADERPIAPLPHRTQLPQGHLKGLFLQARAKSSTLIKKASSAPDVLQPSFYQGNSLGVEVDMAMQAEWTAFTSSKAIADSMMDATPTLEPTRSKRKASNDFGPNGLIRRGTLGQRVPVHSPEDMSLHSANGSMDPQMQQWDMCDDESSCPELSPGTPTTTSPSIGPLTRTSTPANLLELATSITKPEPISHHKRRSSQGLVHYEPLLNGKLTITILAIFPLSWLIVLLILLIPTTVFMVHRPIWHSSISPYCIRPPRLTACSSVAAGAQPLTILSMGAQGVGSLHRW